MKLALLDNYVSYSPEEAHSSPLGGTETSFICLAEALQLREHEIHVYVKDPQTTCYRGVYYQRFADFGRIPHDVVISRWPHLFERMGERFRRRIWWCHKAPDAESVSKAQKLRVYPVLTSRFQAEQLLDLGWRGSFDMIPLGCRLLGFSHNSTPREPFSAVWTSAFDRGLAELIEIWRRVRRSLPPESKLLIAAGPVVYRESGTYLESTERTLRKETRDERDIHWLGPLAPKELFALLSTCGFLPYTATIPESFCLTVLEAQAAGCLPIVTPRGALTERVIHEKTGWIEPLERVEDRILQYTQQAFDSSIAQMRLASRRVARQHTWEDVARRFEQALADCMATVL